MEEKIRSPEGLEEAEVRIRLLRYKEVTTNALHCKKHTYHIHTYTCIACFLEYIDRLSIYDPFWKAAEIVECQDYPMSAVSFCRPGMSSSPIGPALPEASTV